MKTQIAMIFLATALMLTACGEDSKKASNPDNSMSCSAEIVNAYNDIGTKYQWYQKKREVRYLVDVQNSCNQYQSLIGSGSCLARGASTGDLISLSAETVAPFCSHAARELTPGGQTPDAEPQPTPSSGAVKLTELKNGFQIVVHDAVLINQLFATGVNLLLQDGKVVSNLRDLNPNGNYCYLAKKDPGLDVREGDILIMTTLQFRGRQMTAASSDLRAELGCAKADLNGEWTLDQISQVFGATAEVLAQAPANP